MMGKNFSMQDFLGAKLAMLGKNEFVYGLNYPAKTRVEALKHTIEELSRILEASKEMPDDSEFGYQISVELIKKNESDEDRLKRL